MTIIVLIVSIISILLSIIKTWGIVISVVSLILVLILLKINWINEYKKKTLVIAAIISTVAVINSFIFSLYSDTIGNLISTSSEQTSNGTKVSKLLQDYNSVQFSITYYKNSKGNVDRLLKNDTIKIYNSNSTLINVPSEIKKIIANTDNKIKYYPINFNNLDVPLLITNKDYWVIDKFGNVYLNIQNYLQY